MSKCFISIIKVYELLAKHCNSISVLLLKNNHYFEDSKIQGTHCNCSLMHLCDSTSNSLQKINLCMYVFMYMCIYLSGMSSLTTDGILQFSVS